jgi:hypothetical protein
MTDEKKRQKWREASRRYIAKNKEIVLARNKEYRDKKHKENPTWREEKNFRRRAGGLGITKTQWERMFDEQGCACAICGSVKAGSKKGWHLDHCHKTKTVRFILCAHCNRGLGGFKDSPDLLRRAAAALEEFNRRRLEDGKME